METNSSETEETKTDQAWAMKGLNFKKFDQPFEKIRLHHFKADGSTESESYALAQVIRNLQPN